MAERTASTSTTTMGTTTIGSGTTGSRTGAREEAEGAASQMIDEAKSMVREAADTQRKRAADGLGGVADALSRTAGNLNQDNEMMARYAKMAADRIEDAARYIRSADWNDMLVEAENFARRNPAWFIGGAVAAGFLAARMVRNTRADYRPPVGTQYGTAATSAYAQPASAGDLQ